MAVMITTLNQMGLKQEGGPLLLLLRRRHLLHRGRPLKLALMLYLPRAVEFLVGTASTAVRLLRHHRQHPQQRLQREAVSTSSAPGGLRTTCLNLTKPQRERKQRQGPKGQGPRANELLLRRATILTYVTLETKSSSFLSKLFTISFLDFPVVLHHSNPCVHHHFCSTVKLSACPEFYATSLMIFIQTTHSSMPSHTRQPFSLQALIAARKRLRRALAALSATPAIAVLADLQERKEEEIVSSSTAKVLGGGGGAIVGGSVSSSNWACSSLWQDPLKEWSLAPPLPTQAIDRCLDAIAEVIGWVSHLYIDQSNDYCRLLSQIFQSQTISQFYHPTLTLISNRWNLKITCFFFLSD